MYKFNKYKHSVNCDWFQQTMTPPTPVTMIIPKMTTMQRNLTAVMGSNLTPLLLMKKASPTSLKVCSHRALSQRVTSHCPKESPAILPKKYPFPQQYTSRTHV